MTEPVIFLVDMQSFYASIEKALQPALHDQPVVVSGDPKKRSGVILAACPLAKTYGIRNAETLWQAQQKCPHLTVLRPRMQLYLDASLQLTRILEQFSDLVEPYSIDEQFMDVTGSQTLFGSPKQIAEKIQHKIWKQLHIRARIGISSNKALAKMACDQFAKRNHSGIFHLPTTKITEQLWPLPINQLFGVGKRMTHHFHRMGIRSIGELAQFPLAPLKKRWGIQGHVLWMTANGQDFSPVTRQSFAQRKSIGHQMTLPRDYHLAEEIQIILLELCEEVCRRARLHHLQGQTLSVNCRSADFASHNGFSRQISMSKASNHTQTVFAYVWQLFAKHWNHQSIRSLGVSLSTLADDQVVQLNLFEDIPQQMAIGYVMDEIKERFGHTSILRASSLCPAGQARTRAQKIGGHYK